MDPIVITAGVCNMNGTENYISPYEEIRKKNTQRILRSLNKINPEDTLEVSLAAKAKALLVSDKIYRSWKRYIVFNRYCAYRGNYISLIAYADRSDELTNAPYCCSMSTFKEGGTTLWSGNLEGKLKYKCLELIYKQIVKIDLKKLVKGAIIPFDYPVHVNCQIPEDREGFGRNGQDLDKRYGDCSLNLYLIGIRVD